MTSQHQEFVYEIIGRAGGSRPGSHASGSYGSGMMFAAHARLFDRPDPRRIDLRASLNAVPREWLVRTSYQRSAVSVTAVVDVSASMYFGSESSKLAVVADFLIALGLSAHRIGDLVNLMAFDHRFREDLYLPSRRGPGAGYQMAAAIDASAPAHGVAAGVDGLADCIERISGNVRLCFLISDFHWPLAHLSELLQQLAGVRVVPLVIWHRSEIEAPQQNGFLSVYDAESGRTKNLWLRSAIRQQWLDNISRRRLELTRLFGSQGIAPLFIEGDFESEQLSRYFLEQLT